MKKNFLQFNNTRKKFLVIARGRYMNDFCSIFGAISLNKLHKLQPILLQDNYPKNYFLFKYFGFQKKIIIFSYYKLLKDPSIVFFSIINTIKCIYFIKTKGFEWLIDKFSIDNIKIGDLIYDTYTRYNHRYLNPIVDLKLVNIIFKSCFRTLKIGKIIKINKPKLILIGTDGYAYNSGVTMRIGIKNNIKVFEIRPHQIVETKKFKEKFGTDHLRLIYKEKKYTFSKKQILNHYDFKKKNINKIIRYLSTDTLYLANKNKSKDKKQIFSSLKLDLKSDKFDKIILIASHAFSDAPHVVGYQIFRDYYHHIFETLNFINKTDFKKNILWILKEHPASFLYKEENIFKNLVSKFNSKKIFYCPKNINTYDLMNICDHVITTKGSIGLEFAAEGKKPILAGAASYSHLGFTVDPKNKVEYFKILKGIDKLGKLNKKQIFEAKKSIYFLDHAFHHYKVKKSDIIDNEKTSSKYYNNLLKGKISQDQELLLKSTFKNLGKKDIYHDRFYISLNNFFKNFNK